MQNSINDIKKDLRELCIDYVNILEKLKKEEIISHEVFEDCTNNKSRFLEEDIF